MSSVRFLFGHPLGNRLVYGRHWHLNVGWLVVGKILYLKHVRNCSYIDNPIGLDQYLALLINLGDTNIISFCIRMC